MSDNSKCDKTVTHQLIGKRIYVDYYYFEGNTSDIHYANGINHYVCIVDSALLNVGKFATPLS